MKNFLTLIMVLLVSTTVLSQGTSAFDNVLDTGQDLIGLSKLADIDSIKELFIHYTKEAIEGSKDAVSSGVTLIEDAVTMLIEESTIVVRQFIIFTAISFAIPLVFGFLLLWFGFKKVSKYFVTPKTIAVVFNEEADKEEVEWRKENKFILYMGNYFRNKLTLVGFKITQFGIYACGGLLIGANLMSFIKVTFFSKLYLVELLTQYL
tara:strand:+ start:219251 stop:219871 length:621 start_codon:yes stop_codon:yes gene_type:complete